MAEVTNTDWLVIWTAVGAIATLLLVVGVAFAFKQVKQARKSTNAQLAMDLFKELRDEKTIEKLRMIYDSVYDLSKPIDIKDLKGHEKKDIEFVIDRFDVLGVLVNKGIVDDKLAIDAYAGTPSLRCWYLLREYIKEVRDDRGYFGDNLEGLARLSLEHFKETHIKVKFYKKYEEDKGIDLVTKLQEEELRPRSFKKIKKDRKKRARAENIQREDTEKTTKNDDKRLCWKFPQKWWRNLGKKLWEKWFN